MVMNRPFSLFFFSLRKISSALLFVNSFTQASQELGSSPNLAKRQIKQLLSSSRPLFKCLVEIRKSPLTVLLVPRLN
jgi:hypothetical protein